MNLVFSSVGGITQDVSIDDESSVTLMIHNTRSDWPADVPIEYS